MQRAIVLVVVALAVLGLGWILWGPKGKAGLDPAQGARFALGDPNAPVVVVDFSNYLCPHCQNHALNVLPRLKAEYIDTGKVRYLFRDFPFPGQANVIRASEAAACAADQGRYYEYHEVLFPDSLQLGKPAGERVGPLPGGPGRTDGYGRKRLLPVLGFRKAPRGGPG